MDGHKTFRKRRRRRNDARKLVQKLEFQLFNCSKTNDLIWLKNEIDGSDDGWIRMNFLLSKNDTHENEFNPKLLQQLANESNVIEFKDDASFVRLNNQNNTKECKIFVDNLPNHVEVEWIREAFSRFGHIINVDMPKPKSRLTRKNKGFCFVHFSHPTSVQNVLNNFHKNVKKRKRRVSNVRILIENSPLDTSEEPPTKRIRLDPSVPDQNSKRKSRKQSKNRKLRRRRNVELHKQMVKGLAVYSYEEWSRLRCEYLTKQKNNYSALKSYLKSFKIGVNEQKTLAKKKRGREKLEDKAALALDASLKESLVNDRI